MSSCIDKIITEGRPNTKKHLHNWFRSTDRITFKWEKSTNAANTELGPYAIGVKMYFQTELIIQEVLQGMSGTIDIRIR